MHEMIDATFDLNHSAWTRQHRVSETSFDTEGFGDCIFEDIDAKTEDLTINIRDDSIGGLSPVPKLKRRKLSRAPLSPASTGRTDSFEDADFGNFCADLSFDDAYPVYENFNPWSCSKYTDDLYNAFPEHNIYDIFLESSDSIRTYSHAQPVKRLCKRKNSSSMGSINKDASLFQGDFDVGPWQEREQQILLHVLYCFLTSELRIVAEVAWKCEIFRPKRAIDKKVKRILKFSKWRERDLDIIRAELAQIMTDCGIAKLCPDDLEIVEETRQQYLALGLPSTLPLQLQPPGPPAR